MQGRTGDGTNEPAERWSGREDDSDTSDELSELSEKFALKSAQKFALKNAGGLHSPCTPLPCV